MAADHATTLTLQDVSVAFGGIQAVQGVSLHVRAGEVIGLIGPNGAGKTTLLNLISGHVRPDMGSIRVGEHDVTRWPVHRRARVGLARSYQITTVFPGLTVDENIKLAAASRRGSHFGLRYGSGVDAAIAEAAGEALAATGLEGRRNLAASSLGHGESRALEVAMLLASDGRTMLLDEPAAGMAAGEVAGVIETISRLRSRTDATIVIVEHKLSVIFGLCDRIAVLDRGQLLAFGEPQDIAADPNVRRAYLGEDISVG
jgi:branched-chain amino acid transport system ATP-binding protein